MVATFLTIVDHNDRYGNVRERFGCSHLATSQNFNKTLKALNTIAPIMMVKPGSAVPSKIRWNIKFYPFFKDCIGAHLRNESNLANRFYNSNPYGKPLVATALNSGSLTGPVVLVLALRNNLICASERGLTKI
ncbi:hypothetical protein ACLB2K_055871 [Fragaria x ananassa]